MNSRTAKRIQQPSAASIRIGKYRDLLQLRVQSGLASDYNCRS